MIAFIFTGVTMEVSYIRQRVEEVLASSNRAQITEKFIGSLSQQLLKHCNTRAAKLGVTRNQILFDVIYTKPTCRTCGSSNLEFKSIRLGYMQHCSRKCTQQDAEVRNKFKQSMIDSHGVEYTGQSDGLRDKMASTLKRNYGELGHAHPDILKRCRATTLERFGVEHILQDRARFERQQIVGFSIKEFRLAGKKFRLRGYEPEAVRWLYRKLGVPLNKILTTAADGLPSISYTHKSKNHVYHPDIMAKVKNRWTLIEVKSSYTAGLRQDKNGMFSLLKRKAQACVDAGYRFKLAVVSVQGDVYLLENIHEKSRREVMAELKLLHPHARL